MNPDKMRKVRDLFIYLFVFINIGACAFLMVRDQRSRMVRDSALKLDSYHNPFYQDHFKTIWQSLESITTLKKTPHFVIAKGLDWIDGRNGKNIRDEAVIVLTEGLIRMGDDEVVGALIAHELAHLEGQASKEKTHLRSNTQADIRAAEMVGKKAVLKMLDLIRADELKHYRYVKFIPTGYLQYWVVLSEYNRRIEAVSQCCR